MAQPWHVKADSAGTFHCKGAGAWLAGMVQPACHVMSTWPTIWADSQGWIPVLSAEDTLHWGCTLPPADAPERLSLTWLLLPIKQPGVIAGALQLAASQFCCKSASLPGSTGSKASLASSTGSRLTKQPWWVPPGAPQCSHAQFAELAGQRPRSCRCPSLPQP